MDTELLRTFLEVANTRHFGKASDNLCLTQSAVSFRIRQLESLVGTELFSRRRGNIMLTAAGERLQPYAESILSTWQTALYDSGIANPGLQLNLGAATVLWDSCLRVPVQQLLERMPALNLRTEAESRSVLNRGLLEGRLDMVISFTPQKNAEVCSTSLGLLELQMVSHLPDAAVADLSEIGYVHIDWGSAFELGREHLLLAPVAPVLHTGQSRIALDYLMQHGGAALLPEAMLPDAGARPLYPVQGIEPVSRELFCSWLTEGHNQDACRQVSEILQQGFSQAADV